MAAHALNLERLKFFLLPWMTEHLDYPEQFSIDKMVFPEFSGESSVSLIVSASWRESLRSCRAESCSGKWVLRMVPEQSEVFESHDLKLQYDLMSLLKGEGVPVPDLLGYEADSALLGSEFYVMAFVEGQVPPDNPPMAFGSWVTELSAAQRSEMWRNGLSVLAAIHRIPVAHCEIFDSLPRAAQGESVVAHEIAKCDAMVAQGLRDTADPIILQAWDFLKSHVPHCAVRRLCWGDARSGNVIWRNLRPVAMIDWEMASIGNPLMDLTWWLWVDYCNSVGLGVDRLSGLPEFTVAYQQWAELTGLPIDHIAYYELFCVVRFSIIMERKLVHLAARDSAFHSMDNHAVQFIAPLIISCSDAD